MTSARRSSSSSRPLSQSGFAVWNIKMASAESARLPKPLSVSSR